jgi:predicted nucleotidyltransferase
VAEHAAAFGDLIDLGNCGLECLDRGTVLNGHLHVEEDLQATPERGQVHGSVVAGAACWVARVVQELLPALLFRIMQCIVQDMQKSAPPPLLPLLRSRLQAEVLTLVLLNPDREWTLTELASRVGSAVSSVQREIVRAEQAGVMASRRVGKTRLVKAARSPLTGPLTELLLRSFGPRQVLADELADVPGIESAYLFGSWAARYAGQEGRPPADLDVLVIGTPDRDALDDAAQHAGDRLAREVNVTIRSADWWRAGDDGFHTEVKRRPLVPVFAPEGTS